MWLFNRTLRDSPPKNQKKNGTTKPMKHLSKEQREEIKGEMWWAVVTAGITLIFLSALTAFTIYMYARAFHDISKLSHAPDCAVTKKHP